MLLEALAGIFPLAETRLSRNLQSPEWERTSKLGYCLKIRDYPRERRFCLPTVYSCGRTLADGSCVHALPPLSLAVCVSCFGFQGEAASFTPPPHRRRIIPAQLLRGDRPGCLRLA